MSHPSHTKASWTDQLEETLIALLLGAMTLITFANVIARYVFQSNILWALEATVFLFAWLVLIGVSYAVKKNAHLGVDVVINAVSPGTRRILAIIALACCLAFCAFLLVGSWNYWYPYITKNAWYEVNDIPVAEPFQFLSAWFNDGEKYEKLPKFIPYFALPLGMALLTFRLIQAGIRIFKGEQTMLIAGHEVEEAMEHIDPDSIGDVFDNRPDELAHEQTARQRHAPGSGNKEG